MKKNIFLALFFFVVTGLFAVVDKVIVKVNNENILKSDFDKLYNSALEQYTQFSDKKIN